MRRFSRFTVMAALVLTTAAIAGLTGCGNDRMDQLDKELQAVKAEAMQAESTALHAQTNLKTTQVVLALAILGGVAWVFWSKQGTKSTKETTTKTTKMAVAGAGPGRRGEAAEVDTDTTRQPSPLTPVD